jgi:hypothetical protein
VSRSLWLIALGGCEVIVSLRYGQLQNIMKMGPIGKVMQMIPGLGNMMPQVNSCCYAAASRDQKTQPRNCFPQLTWL